MLRKASAAPCGLVWPLLKKSATQSVSFGLYSMRVTSKFYLMKLGAKKLMDCFESAAGSHECEKVSGYEEL